MKRTRLGPGKAALERGSTFKPRPVALKRASAPKRRPRPPRSARARAASGAWVVGLGPCAVCGSTRGIAGHHVVTQQELGHVAAEQGRDLDRLLWDQRNRLALCEGCHAAHHSRARPVPLTILFHRCPGVFDFAEEIDRSWWLERTYPGQ